MHMLCSVLVLFRIDFSHFEMWLTSGFAVRIHRHPVFANAHLLRDLYYPCPANSEAMVRTTALWEEFTTRPCLHKDFIMKSTSGLTVQVHCTAYCVMAERWYHMFGAGVGGASWRHPFLHFTSCCDHNEPCNERRNLSINWARISATDV